MNRLYLVRHGENLANLTKEFSHRLIDYSLTAKGVQQSQQTATFFEDKNIHEIYASPLKRAVETAEIIAAPLELEVTVLENFREINIGALESQPVSAENWARYNRIIDDWFAGKVAAKFPNGEDYVTLWRRMHDGVKQVVANKNGRNIIIVGHGGIFTITLKDLCPAVDLAQIQQGENHNCSITEILVTAQNDRLRGRLVSWAAYAHLHGPAADLIPGAPREDEWE